MSIKIYILNKYLFSLMGIFFVSLFFISPLFAQGLINNGAAITINANASSAAPYLIIDGGANGIFTNQASGASQGQITVLNTGGTMIVPGNWNNTASNSVFSGDGSTVLLNGSNTQRIGPASGSGGVQTGFFNLTLGGTQVKTLDVNASVGGTDGTGILDLADRMLELNQNTLTVTNSTSGTSATSAVRFTTGGIYSEAENSIVSWKVKASSGNHIYPFWNALTGGTYIPLEFNVSAAGSESALNTGTVGISTFYSANNATTPASVTNMLPAETNAADRFWSFTVSGYTSGSEPTTDLYFHYDPSSTERGGVAEANLLAQEWTSNWQSPVGTLNDASDYVVVSGKKPKSNPWVLGNGPSPLPVSLLSLTAECESNYVKINWTTASERNNKMFVVERLNAFNSFVPVDSVAGAGNSYRIKNYAVKDMNCSDKSCYYRLKQIDFDGAVEYSKLVAVSCQNNKDFDILKLSEDAETKNLILMVNASENEDFAYTLYNAVGQQIINNQSSVSKGMNTLNLELSGVSQGVYFLVIKNEKRMIVKKIPLHY